MCIRDSVYMLTVYLPILCLSLIHISEPTSPLYIAYAVFCLKKRVRVLRRLARRLLPYDRSFFQAEDGIRDVERSRGLGDVYKRQT